MAMDLTEKKGLEQLFQDSWFFGNLLRTNTSCSKNKPKSSSMLRSFSDPSPSSSYDKQEVLTACDKSYEETYESIKKLQGIENPCLMKKAPSMPSRNRNEQALSSTLVRAPSFPTTLVGSAGGGESEDDDEEVEFSMGKLIRQASMKRSDHMPPRTHVLTPSSSMSRQRSMEVDTIIPTEVSEDVIPQVPMKKLQPQKSLTTSLRSEELQGFKDLGFQFEKIDLIIPIVASSVGPNFRREALWGGHSSAPPVGGRRSTSNNDMMKEQIKFWARAVAYNVRQEC